MPFISQSNFLQALGWAVISSLWQMALLWLVYQVFIFVTKPGSAAKSKTAFVFLCAGTIWFIAGFFIALNSSPADTIYINSNAVPYVLNDSIARWMPLASLIYLVLLAVPVIKFIINFRQVVIIRKRSLKKIEVQWRLFVKKMSAYLEIRRPVQVWISENISSPVTVGFLKPVILVPLAAINNLSTQQMEAVLLHELAHIKRNDYLINIITAFIRTIFYFNPFIRNLAAVIEEEREKNCDEWVLRYQYDAYSYSSALLALEKIRTSSLCLALAATKNKQLLLERVKRIMGLNEKPVYSIRNTAVKLGGFVFAALIFIALFSKPKQKAATDVTSYSPFAFYTGSANPDISFNTVSTSPVAEEKIKTENTAEALSKLTEFFDTPSENKLLQHVNFIETPAPVLEEEQEVQVKEAMDASKKILKEVQWNEVEKAAADALNNREKAVLEHAFKMKLENNVDWHRLEDKLRQSYNQVNWDKMNVKINEALYSIQLDSLAKAYTLALNNLARVKIELNAEGLKGIPDSKISVTELDSMKKEIETALRKVKQVKEKKIIRL